MTQGVCARFLYIDLDNHPDAHMVKSLGGVILSQAKAMKEILKQNTCAFLQTVSKGMHAGALK